MQPQDTGLSELDPLLGQTVGNYQITHKLGEGGMGSVYLAEHPKIGKKVALKILHAEFGNNADVVGRFFNEARAVNDIQHPNIVDIVDYGIIPNGPRGDTLVYFIMEYLGGRTLTQTLRNESPFPPERALSIALQIADALAASHRCGIVHRDLKPDNIMLTQRGREIDFVKLLDFGIAKLTGDSATSSRTRTGIVMGTPWYMSPEQCEGRGQVDHRADIYALGVVMYEMITGRVPFLGEGYGEVLVQHLTQTPQAPSTFRGVAPHIEAVIMKALQKRPDMRFPDMDEFMRAISDPIGYIDAMGGIGAFSSRIIMPSNLAGNAVALPVTYAGSASLTPQPGSMAAVTIPQQAPTTLGGSARQVHPPATGTKKKIGIAVGASVLIGAAIAAVMVTQGNHAPPIAPTVAVAPPTPVLPTPLPPSVVSANPIIPPPPAPPALPAMVTIDITTSPAGAQVKFDGVNQGPSPAHFQVGKEARKVPLELSLAGFETVTDQVDLSSGLASDYPLHKKAVAVTPSPHVTPSIKKPPITTPTQGKPVKPIKPVKPVKPHNGGGDNLMNPDDI